MDNLNDIINTIKTARLISDSLKTEEQQPVQQVEATVLEDSPAIRSIKAAIPYLEGNYRRGIGVALKLMEINSLLNQCYEIKAQQSTDSRQMLMAVKKELPKDKQPIADFLMKLLEIREIALSLNP